jgi:1-acyl-sn-glycerol-3-phosphate acyltransferase
MAFGFHKFYANLQYAFICIFLFRMGIDVRVNLLEAVMNTIKRSLTAMANHTNIT